MNFQSIPVDASSNGCIKVLTASFSFLHLAAGQRSGCTCLIAVQCSTCVKCVTSTTFIYCIDDAEYGFCFACTEDHNLGVPDNTVPGSALFAQPFYI